MIEFFTELEKSIPNEFELSINPRQEAEERCSTCTEQNLILRYIFVGPYEIFIKSGTAERVKVVSGVDTSEDKFPESKTYVEKIAVT